MVRIHSFLLGALWAFVSAAQGTVYEIPSAVQNGTSQAQFTSTATGLDAPKVHPVNASAFDWWYFDVVSTDPTVVSSVVLTFFTSSQPAFPLLAPSESITVARIWVSFPNGTLWEASSDATGATVTAEGNTSSGIWHGTGFSWAATPAAGYLINIDAPDAGVKGTISFKSVAPGHYPCGPVEAGQNLEVGPHIGWANAVPDAASVVDLNIGGSRLAFKGTGYHDKNWSDQIFTTNVASWYWGHGRIGPYSIVWFDFLDLTGTEFVSAYASKDDKIVAASCTLGSIKVRPTGQNATYPPGISTGNPSGYHIDLDLGAHGKLEVDVSVLAATIPLNPTYARSVGNMSGSLVPLKGRATTGLTGTALFEQFKLT
ncbi:hypothetical protein B0H17DRAFT_1013780 [Mycena rosella]|uniref:Hydroxyneurosporene synthase n=1 Tax=Mycena rosella TaxID=1033263 RepID=A0AAD7GB69_MYCRO|nr:hypothetical protein B0H17DRAFT_1013780 [Mycena rosella]